MERKGKLPYYLTLQNDDSISTYEKIITAVLKSDRGSTHGTQAKTALYQKINIQVIPEAYSQMQMTAYIEIMTTVII